MNIQEMHVMFRQYAQQMGMQNIRVILPEQIDLVLNTSIMDVTNRLVRSSVDVINDRIINDNSKIQQINSLRTLYKVKNIDITPQISYNSISIVCDTFQQDHLLLIEINGKRVEILIPTIDNKVKLSSFKRKVDDLIATIINRNDFKTINWNYEYYLENNDKNIWFTFVSSDNSSVSTASIAEIESTASKTEKDTAIKNRMIEAERSNIYFIFNESQANIGKLTGIDFPIDYLFAIDFSISYRNAKKGYNNLGLEYEFEEHSFVTNIYPVRLIDDVFLADTLNDFQLSPKLRSPIIVNHDNSYDLYFPRFEKSKIGYTLKNNLLPYQLRVAYIAKPAVVRFDEDLLGENVDCDLPEHLHVDIVKHAVDLYMQAVGKGDNQRQEQEAANNGQSTTIQQQQ